MSWKSIADLLTEGEAPLALVGAPLATGSVTPGRCDLAPGILRRTLKRFSTYDVEAGVEVDLRLRDLGDIDLHDLSPAEAFKPIVEAVRTSVSDHELVLLIGGNNAVTRPAVHGLGFPLEKVGLITLDAHFDMRETDRGPMNGNPVRCLLEDGLPGRNLVQIGLAPFANTRKMHQDVVESGAAFFTIGQCLEAGIGAVIDEALERLGHVESLLVDFDIDVIDRSGLPGAPGARPGGMPVQMFFDAARRLASEPRVRVVDLTEFDPSLDLSDISALTAARWLCEIMAGYSDR